MLLENSGGGAAVSLGNDDGGAEKVREEEDDLNSAGNRWPQQETEVLLEVRLGMDEAFKDSPLKAPLWDEVSRKLAEFGYHRSAKKCKEKFENVYKYHRRTKEGRSGRQDGKNYRFYEQLEVLDSRSSIHTEQRMPKTLSSVLMVKPVSQVPHGGVVAPSFAQTPSFEFLATSTSTTSSSGKDAERNVKKKRKLLDYFDGLMNQVLARQENLQNKFIEAIEKFEKDRMIREEQWKAEQLARKRKEQGILDHERSVSAAKDAAILSFLQKISEEPRPLQLPEMSSSLEKILSMKEFNIRENLPVAKSVSDNSTQAASSRWPKSEVEDLITLKENLDMHYRDTGPKGPLWEEISAAMKKLGYDRSAKRCKEKWENINKYYKRVKDMNKKRPQDSKTCPYFHRLELLYERKSKKFDNSTSDSSGCNLKPEDILMQLTGHHHQQEDVIQPSGTKDYEESENVDRSPEHDEEEGNDEDEDEYEDDYEVVGNSNTLEAMQE